MDKNRERTYELIEKAMEGKGLAYDEMEFLYGIDPRSRESYEVRWAAQ